MPKAADAYGDNIKELLTTQCDLKSENARAAITLFPTSTDC